MRSVKGLRFAVLLVVPMFMLGPAADFAVAANKLFVGSLSWDTDDQSITVPMAVQKRYALYGSYYVVTLVTVLDDNGNLLAQIQSDPHRIRPLNPLDDRVVVPVVPQSIRWDRNGGSYTGRGTILVVSQLFDGSGRQVSEGRTRGFGFVVFDDSGA